MHNIFPVDFCQSSFLEIYTFLRYLQMTYKYHMVNDFVAAVIWILRLEKETVACKIGDSYNNFKQCMIAWASEPIDCSKPTTGSFG